jgi:hypothetical protein
MIFKNFTNTYELALVEFKKNLFYTIFFTKNNTFNELVIENNNELITNTSNLKFIGVMIDIN